MSHAGGRVEIAANNGHNRASSASIPHSILIKSPRMTLSFEDFPIGRFGTFGPRHVTREEILAFAAEFDPQPMHLDEEAAKRSMLKGLSGSGWHLCSIMMRMMFDGFIVLLSSIASVIVGVIFSRIAAEFILIVFRINEHLGAIRDQGQGQGH